MCATGVISFPQLPGAIGLAGPALLAQVFRTGLGDKMIRRDNELTTREIFGSVLIGLRAQVGAPSHMFCAYASSIRIGEGSRLYTTCYIPHLADIPCHVMFISLANRGFFPPVGASGSVVWGTGSGGNISGVENKYL